MDLRPRALLGRLDVLADRADPHGQTPREDAQPPADTTPDTAPDKAPDTSGRLPAWWLPKPDILTASEPKPTPEPTCDHPTPHALNALDSGVLVAYWCADCETQLPIPEPGDDEHQDDQNEETSGGAGSRIRRYWQRCAQEDQAEEEEARYRRPSYRGSSPPKQALVESWSRTRPKTRHLLYNGSALVLGFAVGIPQVFTAAAAHIAATSDSWTDYNVLVWGAIALAVWMFDHKSRFWFPPFALVARMPLVSMVIGLLMYGGTEAVA